MAPSFEAGSEEKDAMLDDSSQLETPSLLNLKWGDCLEPRRLQFKKAPPNSLFGVWCLRLLETVSWVAVGQCSKFLMTNIVFILIKYGDYM